MRSNRWGSVALTLVLLAAAFVPNPSGARAQQAASGGDCSYEPSSTVDVVLLLDQSGSLKGSDPAAQRVPGAKAVVNAFASLSKRVAGVRILVAGFGTHFVPGEWTPLTAETTSGVLTHIELFRERDRDLHTDYAEAMHGVVKAFSTSLASCKLLFWFTDGEHDLDPIDSQLARGLQRSYPADNPVSVTLANREDVEARMPELICGEEGYADQLGKFGVEVRVLLLGSGEDVDRPSRRVLEGMGGDPDQDCGRGIGSFANVEKASDLPYELACSAQAGTFKVDLPPIENGVLTVTDTDIDKGEIPAALVISLRLFAAGPGGPPGVTAANLPGMEESTDGTDVLSVSADLAGQPFSFVLSDVDRACLFVIGVAPTLKVTQATPALYQGELGEFSILVLGPHGELTGTSLDRIRVEADPGDVARAETRNVIRVDRMPESETFRLAVSATVVGDDGVELWPPSNAEVEFPVSEPSKAPRIVERPEPIEAEGTGPFVRPLIVNGGDGGTLCLEENQSVMMDDADGSPLNVTATLNGQRCVDVPPGENQRVDLAISTSRQANADDVLEFRTTATSATRPDQLVPGIVEVDLKVLPIVNTVVLRVIVATILLILIGLLWAVLYGVNRLVARIPDVRRNRVRFGEFTARLTSDELGGIQAELVDAPEDAQLRVPRATASQLKAGRLTLRRRVPIRPWVAPGAELTLGTDVVAARIGSGASQAVVLGDKRLRTRSRVALGPLVAIGVAKGQLERVNETAQSVHGVVLFDTRSALGQDAGGVVAELIRAGLAEIGGRLAKAEAPQAEGTTRR